MKYILEGKPIPLARARKGKRNFYNPQQHQFNTAKIQLAHQHADKPMISGPIEITGTFYFPIPQHISRTQRPLMRKTNHYKRPDLSNCIKFIEDVCHNIIYTDDCIISSINMKKQYDTNPRTEFTITPLKKTIFDKEGSKP